MTIRHVIYTQVPGIDGDGITTIEKEQLVQKVDSIAPPAPGNDADQLRTTMGGPRWLPPETVSPLLWDAAADGTTNDYAAIMSAIDYVKTNGGTVNFQGKTFRSNSTIVLDGGTNVTIDGGGSGALIYFPDTGIDGLVLQSGFRTVVRNIRLRVEGITTSRTSEGTGTGVTVRSGMPHLEHVEVVGFGRDGFAMLSPSIAPGNNNRGFASQITGQYCGRHGIYLAGIDSNVWTFVNADAIYNRGYSIYNDAMYGSTFITPHDYTEGQGSYFENSWNSTWITPYSEGNNKMVFGNDSRSGFFFLGNNGVPTIWSGDPSSPTEGAPSGAFGHTIIRNGRHYSRVRMQSTFGAENTWNFQLDNPGINQFALNSSAAGNIFIATANPGDSRFSIQPDRLSFYDATPITKPTVTGSRGGNAALQSLLTALANLGLITNNSS